MAVQILSMCNGAVSRARAFESQGVTLTFPARSRSGVRDCDGVVVFAMAAVLVRIDDWGSSCLLWAPAPRAAAAAAALDRASDRESLEHCRLAVRCGLAEGFLLYGDEASAGCEGMLSLRVVKSGRNYWARWGRMARTESPRGRARAGSVRI
jgi:hypothetical protein